MSRAEIKRKFDEIVAFAEVEKFLDTPVKRYSSGMYVRLAFAVAAHLEPEILIVDEVLAVGDAEFQKKCLGKMDDAGHTGRTVLFVSHNMQAVTRLSTALRSAGERAGQAGRPPQRVASAYLSSGVGTTAVREWPDLSTAPGDDVVRLCAVRVRSEDGELADTVDIRRPVGIELEYEVLEAGYIFHPAFRPPQRGRGAVVRGAGCRPGLENAAAAARSLHRAPAGFLAIFWLKAPYRLTRSHDAGA